MGKLVIIPSLWKLILWYTIQNTGTFLFNLNKLYYTWCCRKFNEGYMSQAAVCTKLCKSKQNESFTCHSHSKLFYFRKWRALLYSLTFINFIKTLIHTSGMHAITSGPISYKSPLGTWFIYLYLCLISKLHISRIVQSFDKFTKLANDALVSIFDYIQSAYWKISQLFHTRVITKPIFKISNHEFLECVYLCIVCVFLCVSVCTPTCTCVFGRVWACGCVFILFQYTHMCRYNINV